MSWKERLRKLREIVLFSFAKYRHGPPIVPVSSIAEQYYCEVKVDLKYKIGDIDTLEYSKRFREKVKIGYLVILGSRMMNLVFISKFLHVNGYIPVIEYRPVKRLADIASKSYLLIIASVEVFDRKQVALVRCIVNKENEHLVLKRTKEPVEILETEHFPEEEVEKRREV